MSPNGFGHGHHRSPKGPIKSCSLAMAAIVTLGCGFPQLGYAFLSHMNAGRTTAPLHSMRNLGYWGCHTQQEDIVGQSGAATCCTMSSSSEMQQETGYEEHAGGVVGEAGVSSAAGLGYEEPAEKALVQTDDGDAEEGAKRWSWGRKRRKRHDGQEKARGLFTYDWENGSRIVWEASKTSKVEVEEGTRSLNDYLALPPTEYSLLDPKMVTRLSDETFRMDGGTMNIVGTKFKPVLFVRVKVQPEKSLAEIMVERVELEGSEAVRNTAGSFNVTSSTLVSCAERENTGQTKLMELSTSSAITIDILVPNENFVPLGVLRRAGNFVMQRVVDIGVPQFTKFLRRDYVKWAEGDDTRGAVVSEGEALIASEDI